MENYLTREQSEHGLGLPQKTHTNPIENQKVDRGSSTRKGPNPIKHFKSSEQDRHKLSKNQQKN